MTTEGAMEGGGGGGKQRLDCALLHSSDQMHAEETNCLILNQV